MTRAPVDDLLATNTFTVMNRGRWLAIIPRRSNGFRSIRANRITNSAAFGKPRLGCRTSRRRSSKRGLQFLSRQADHWPLGALRHGNLVHGLSRRKNPRRHDHAQPRDAQGADLLFLPRKIRRTPAACPDHKRILRRLPRFPQQRPADAPAESARALSTQSKTQLTASPHSS